MHRLLRQLTLGFVMVTLSAQARADASVALGSSGATERLGLTHDAPKNGSAASFGAPVTDDRRLFVLRWRLPWALMAGDNGVGAAPFAGGFSPLAGIGGTSLAAEPMRGASSLIPTFGIGEPHKVARAQVGALSASVGHGSLVDRYSNSPEGLSRTIGVLGEVNLAGLGALALVGDVFSPQTFAAGRVYGRPLMWFLAPDATFQPNELDLDPRTELAGIWVTGVSGVIDAQAPSTRGAHSTWAVGWDNEAALLDTQLFKIIPYLDLNALGGQRGTPGLGAHPGASLMVDVLGFRGDISPELNFGTNGYTPRYFDRLYTIEREHVFGSKRIAKVDVDRPASWGWQVRSQGSWMEWLTLFSEAGDQTPFDAARGHSNAHITTGASAWLLFFGGSLVASQTGITDYLDPHVGGRGFIITAEGRVALLFNVVHVVGRTWRAHLPAGDSKDDYVVNQGATLGMELNFDFL